MPTNKTITLNVNHMSSGDKTKSGKESPSLLREKEALLCLSLFFHSYLITVYGDEDLDLVSISLLHEIAQHNLEPFTRGSRLQFPKDAEEMELMRGCNAFSLSQATGVPRETARRKIKQLVELGWIEQHNRTGLFITTKWMDRLSGGDALTLLGEWKATTAQIGKLLGK